MGGSGHGGMSVRYRFVGVQLVLSLRAASTNCTFSPRLTSSHMSRTLSKVQVVPCLRGVGTICTFSVGRRYNLYLGCASLPPWTYPPFASRQGGEGGGPTAHPAGTGRLESPGPLGTGFPPKRPKPFQNPPKTFPEPSREGFRRVSGGFWSFWRKTSPWRTWTF